MSRRQLKIGLWFCISFIVIAFLTIGYQDQIPIQFTDEEVRSNAKGILIITIPLALFLATFAYHRLGYIRGLPVLHTLFAAILGIVLFISAAIMSFFTPQWSDEALLYRGRFTNKKVILQDDSWDGKTRIIKTSPFVSGLRHIVPIDTCNLPDNKWIKVSETQHQP